MKKFFVLSLFFAFSAVLFAQVEVTKFLGIPVDGTAAEMISKLKEKGFTSVSSTTDMLEGEFNGKNVYVTVQTNNRKVWRVGVIDTNGYDETQVKIEFNNLCRQFKANSKYVGLDGQTIPESEDVGYEVDVHNKRYEVVFFQKLQTGDLEIDDEMRNRMVWFLINKSPLGYGKYCIMIYYENGYNKANGEDL